METENDLVKQFKEKLEAMTPEDKFELACRMENIDPNDKHAKLKLWWSVTGYDMMFGFLHRIGEFCFKTLILMLVFIRTAFLAEDNQTVLHVVLYTIAYILLSIYGHKAKDWFWRNYR